MVQSGRFCGAMAAVAAAFSIPGAAPGEARDRPAPVATKAVGAQVAGDGQLRTAEVEPGRYELIYLGRRLRSRADVEHYLLYRAALLARAKGAISFSLLYLPGEEGPTRHPAPPSPSSGPDYGHWQPHWTYYVTGFGWQPWHPEWGAAFWADGIDAARVEKYEAHAIVRLSDGAELEEGQPDFSVSEVLRHLEPRFR